jgi:hypothetical protein
MFDSALSAPQLQVVDALLNGANLNAAAELAGVHRNTIANWRHTSPAFQSALAVAQAEMAQALHEEALARAAKAFQALDQILDDPKSSTSARLRAALFILNHAMPGARSKSRMPYDYSKPVPPEPAAEAPAASQNFKNLHKNAQIQPEPYRRSSPKIGRNDRCPCGSGKKFKQCCLNKPKPPRPDRTGTRLAFAGRLPRHRGTRINHLASLSVFIRVHLWPYCLTPSQVRLRPCRSNATISSAWPRSAL